MADRSVIYRIIADVSSLKRSMAQASQSVGKTAHDMEGANKSTGKLSQGMDAVGVSAMGVGAALGTKVVMSAANFEQAMSSVQAATHESEATMSALEKAAIDAGESTVFSATEAAAGIENLAKAGVSTGDILGGGLTGALDLAAAGNLEVGAAAEIAATALTQFNLAGEDVPHVADLLAAGAGKAQGEVSDLAQALNQSGLVASQMGLSLEETTGTLSAFASAGLLGSDAGTSMRTMLLRLANPTQESAELMRQLGINAYDAQGNFIGMEALAGQLQTAFQGQSQATRDAAMATLFGSDAIRAANVLYSQGGAGIEKWTANVDDAGYAAETAAIRMDNLKGSFEEMMGALESRMIEQGQTVLPVLDTLTDAATKATEAYDAIDTRFSRGFTLGTMDLATIAGGPLTLFSDAIQNTTTAWDDYFGSSEKAAKSSKDAGDAAVDSSVGTHAAAAALEEYQHEAEQATERTEAQIEAMKESREAARGTASSFFNLGDSLNKAKVSLGGWLKDLEKQAEDLRNFRKNAQEAADKGLRQGLIAALQEAGPEGARRMRQLANATDSEIKRANRAWESGQREINRYTDAVGGVPVTHATELRVHAAAAMQDIANLETRLRNIADEDVFVNVRHRRAGAPASGYGPDFATGGPVYGPGTATSDSIPAYLSNGEYVIKTAAVDHYGVDFFHRLNAMRFASGGHAVRVAPPQRVSFAPASVDIRDPWGGTQRVELIARAAARSEIAADHNFDRMMTRS